MREEKEENAVLLSVLLITRWAGALRRARLLPVFAPCLLMRSVNIF
jgi:hypothetical protein